MAATVRESLEHVGETRGIENHDHDLLQDLSRRLDGLWRYDQYIANADGMPELQKCWRDFKHQEQANVDRLKKLIAEEVRKNCF